MPFDAALFDMDGTLLDSEAVYLSAFVDAAKQFDLPEPEAFGRELIGIHSEECIRRVKAILPSKAAQNLVEVWYKGVSSRLADEIALKPGAQEAIEYLRSKGQPVGVVTSSRSENAEHHLAKAGLLPMLDFVIGGDQVARRKPHPEPYKIAIKRLALPAHRVLVFEDSAAGVQSAHSAGARVVQVPDIVQPSAPIIALGHQISKSITEGFASLGVDIHAR